ncbi:Serine/threonine-protein kinase ulk3, partial [Borealophlyctis nickersoniae]
MSTHPVSPPSYIPLRNIGQGTSGTVYLCRPKPHLASRDVNVAVKVIDRSHIRGAAKREEKVTQEISILKRLKHENVVGFVDLEWDSHYVYIVMEYCQLGSLKDYIGRRPGKRLSEQEARPLLRQLAAGLAFLWSHGLVHRDLKTANLLLSQSANSAPVLKIADFGIADYDEERRSKDVLNEGVSLTERIGTLLYMAPEVLRDGSYDARCDLWSVGAIFYEMLVGQPPFASSPNLDHLYKQILSPSPPQLSLPSATASQVSSQAQQLISLLLTRNPSSRISFQSFLTDPYLDLDHLPGPDSLNRGMEAVALAVAKDERLVSKPIMARQRPSRAKEIDKVVNLYADAIAHLLAHVQYVGPKNVEDGITERIKMYMDRAEELKDEMKRLTGTGD